MTVVTPPAGMTYGYVVGRFLLAQADGTDGNLYPDLIAATALKVQLAPVAPVHRTTAPDPATILPDPIVCDIPANGWMTDPMGNNGVWLHVGQYNVTFPGLTTISGFTIEVTAAHTGASPLDLTLHAPIVPNPSIKLVVNEDLYNRVANVIPVGGASGQVLTKASGTDLDIEWATPSGGVGGGTELTSYAQITALGDYPNSFNPGPHNHDGTYQPAGDYAAGGHDHDGVYALVGHSHSEYQPVGDYVTSAGLAAALEDFDPGGYAPINHNHDGVYQPVGNYAPLNHNHNSAYAAIGHNHDGDYQPPGSYANTVHTHVLGDIDGFGTVGAQLAAIETGQELHDVLEVGGAVFQGDDLNLLDSEGYFLRVNVPDDGSPTATWPDRLSFYFQDPSQGSGWTRAGYFNEYGELRARPANDNTVGFRAMADWRAAPDQEFFQVSTNQGDANRMMGIDKEHINLYAPLRHGPSDTVLANTIVIDEGEPVPVGTPEGTVVVVRPL